MPVRVVGLTDVVGIAAGQASAYAIKSDHTVWAWGTNDFGDLGDGTKVNRSTPVQVIGLHDIIAVAGGDNSDYALSAGGTVWAWGSNDGGQLGDGTVTDRLAPVQVVGLTGVTAIAHGMGATGYALAGDGSVWAWGGGRYGQTGTGLLSNEWTPVGAVYVNRAVSIAAGYWSAYAVDADGAVWVWGKNDEGQLGDGTTNMVPRPGRRTGLAGITGIAAGSDSAYAWAADGTMWAWGNNNTGQLGDGTTASRLSPVPVPGLAGTTAFAAGLGTAYALIPAEASPHDHASVSLGGGVGTGYDADLTSGDLSVATDGYGVMSVTGLGTVGTGTVSFDIHRFWVLPLHLGTVRVSDTGLNYTAFVLGKVSSPGAGVATGTTTFGGDFTKWPWRTGNATFTVTDAG